MSLADPAPGGAAPAQILRRHDRDRYLTTLFAPADRRAALVALYAVNFEIAKTREVVSEELLGRMRLEWWRETIDAIYRGVAVRRHEVATPLAAAIRRFDLTRSHFDRLIAAREADLEAMAPPENLAALQRYAEETSSRLVWLALEVLGAREAAAGEAGRRVGIAFAFTGLIRAMPVHLRARRIMLPGDLCAAAGLDLRDALELRPSPALAQVTAAIADAARAHLAAARERRPAVPRRALAALLPAVLAGAHLRRLAAAGHDPLAPSLAIPDALASWRLAAAALLRRY